MVLVKVNGYTIEPGADLIEANLSGANLDQAYFGAASLLEADLTGARLTGEKLEHADLWEARADRDTVWPEGFDPEAAGVIFED